MVCRRRAHSRRADHQADAGARGQKHAMVIVVPIYEEEITGVYYNTAAVIDADGKLSRQVPQEPHSAGRGLLREVLLQAGQSRLSGVPDRLLPARRLYLLRPALPRGLAGAGAERRRVHRQPLGHRRRSQPVSLGARAAGRGGGQRLLHRRRQPRRHASSRGTSAASTARPISSIRAARSSPRRARTRTSCWSPTWTWTWCATSATSGSSSATAGRRPIKG